MAKLVLKGVLPDVDGSYDFDLADGFTKAEWHTIKTLAGVLPLGFVDALRGGDQDLYVAIAVIALERAGKSVLPEMFDQAKGGWLAFEGEERDARPPSMTSEPSEKPPAGSGSSGPTTSESSDVSQATGRSRTGDQTLATSAT